MRWTLSLIRSGGMSHCKELEGQGGRTLEQSGGNKVQHIKEPSGVFRAPRRNLGDEEAENQCIRQLVLVDLEIVAGSGMERITCTKC